MSATRESKQFWAVDYDEAKKVTGYACPPNPGMWWCPELGFSGEERYHFFKTEQEAKNAAIIELEEELAKLSKAVAKLKRKKIKSK